MKTHHQSRAGITLVEMMITTVLIAALGLMVFSILYSGITLGAKNSAVNTAHQQSRAALLHMTQNLHGAVSAPILVDLSGNPTAATPAQGVAFEKWAGGPFQVSQDTADATRSVTINLGQPVTAGQRLIIPGFNLEQAIQADANAGTVTLTWPAPSPIPSPAPSPVPITGTQAPTNYNVSCFVTDKCYYVVNNGSLEWHPTGVPDQFVVLARGIDSATPFSIAANNAVKIDLSTFDTKSSNRGAAVTDLGYKSTRVLLSETIPIRTNPPLASLP
jgi:type II secretory pathway pseudopilin PulG